MPPIFPLSLFLFLLPLFSAQPLPADVQLPFVYLSAPSAFFVSLPKQPPIPLRCTAGFLTEPDRSPCCRNFNVACPAPPAPPICASNPGADRSCCTVFSIGCPGVGLPCSSNVECGIGLACVITDLGENKGTCRAVDPFGLACTRPYCEDMERNVACVLPGPVYTICGIWLDFLDTPRPTPLVLPLRTPTPVEDLQMPDVSPESGFSENPDASQEPDELEASANPDPTPLDDTLPPIEPDAAFPTTVPFPTDDLLSGGTLPSPDEPGDIDPTCAQTPISTTDANRCCSVFDIGCAALGAPCSIGGSDTGPTGCERPLVCVVTDFGRPAADMADVGECMVIPPRGVAECTVSTCSRGGADAPCVLPMPTGPLMTTCGAWARPSSFLAGPDCGFACNEECIIGAAAPVGSDGRTYCSECQLRSESCLSGFVLFGPVDTATDESPDHEEMGMPAEASAGPAVVDCDGDISIFDAAECCHAFDIGCIAEGKRCSTLGSRISTPACEAGLVCVISDFGFPPANIPNSGTCAKLDNEAADCSLALCSTTGAAGICAASGIAPGVSSCGAWATRSDGNPGADCEFFCSQICNPGPGAPLGSDGVTYCSECHLQAASCKSNFRIFGPVNT